MLSKFKFENMEGAYYLACTSQVFGKNILKNPSSTVAQVIKIDFEINYKNKRESRLYHDTHLQL